MHGSLPSRVSLTRSVVSSTESNVAIIWLNNMSAALGNTMPLPAPGGCPSVDEMTPGGRPVCVVTPQRGLTLGDHSVIVGLALGDPSVTAGLALGDPSVTAGLALGDPSVTAGLALDVPSVTAGLGEPPRENSADGTGDPSMTVLAEREASVAVGADVGASVGVVGMGGCVVVGSRSVKYRCVYPT